MTHASPFRLLLESLTGAWGAPARSRDHLLDLGQQQEHRAAASVDPKSPSADAPESVVPGTTSPASTAAAFEHFAEPSAAILSSARSSDSASRPS